VPVIDFRSAVREALDEALAADDRLVFFGEDVAIAGGVFAVTPGLYEKYGADRVFDTPISELALAGAAFGSAVNGLRPVVEIMFGDFLPLVMDSVVNQMSKYLFLTRGEVGVPVVIRSVVGAGGSPASQVATQPSPCRASVSDRRPSVDGSRRTSQRPSRSAGRSPTRQRAPSSTESGAARNALPGRSPPACSTAARSSSTVAHPMAITR